MLKGPETVVIGPNGEVYALTEKNLVLLKDFEDKGKGIYHAKTEAIMKDMEGRALGGRFTVDGEYLYLADAVLGLTRIKDPSPTATVEVVSNSVVLKDGEVSPILHADDVAIGPHSGKVYFTDATDIAPTLDSSGSWDVMYASKMDLARGGRRRGRVLEYDPSANTTKLLATGLHFANGIAVDEKESYLVVSETFQARSQKYYLKGPKAGTLEPLDFTFMSYSDGVDCSPELCYVALPSPPPDVMKLVYKIPHPFDILVRTIFMWMPRWAIPAPVRFGGLAVVQPGTDETPARFASYILDTKGVDNNFLTGVTYHEGKLYLGYLHENYITIFDINPEKPPSKGEPVESPAPVQELHEKQDTRDAASSQEAPKEVEEEPTVEKHEEL